MDTARAGTDRPALAAIKLSKAFGGVQALEHASFAAVDGEVHALVGENGAGKSTLIKLIGGRLRPDAGDIRVYGRSVQLHRPDSAHALGIRTVFQELTLLRWLTVAENLLLRHEPRGAFGLVHRGRMAASAEAILAGLGVRHIDPRALIDDLSLAKRQIVEIVRVIVRNPEILLLDEPTSSLGEREVDWLFGLVQRMRANGKCIIFTSHRWNEITDLADRITIFRNGTDVGTFTKIAETEAVTLMTGRRIEAVFPPIPASSPAGPVVLEARGLSGARISDVSFVLCRSAILGVGGLTGHGHRELFLSLFGAERITKGEILVDGAAARITSPRRAARLGIALVPEDRKGEGLLLPMSVRANLTLTILRQLSALGVIRAARERRLAREMVDTLNIRTPGLASPVGQLSGGNQQKVLLGRWLLAQSRVLLLYDVTRGVDVATKHEIYELMMRLAAEGRALLFYSSDAEELAHLCHEVVVMREGRVAARLEARNLTAEGIVAAAMRGSVVH